MLAMSIIGPSYAQDNQPTNSEKIFEISSNFFRLRYLIDLGKGNKLQIELRDIKDLNRLGNPDSLLRMFLGDIQLLKDSLSDELSSKRIDYITDSAGRKKIRVQQFKPKGSNFIVDHGDLASLKLEQDTVNFLTTFSYYAKYTLRKGFTDISHYRITFFVNQLSDLNNYLDGSLNKKLTVLKKNVKSVWVNAGKGRVNLYADRSISSKYREGYLSAPGVTIEFSPILNLQNYKSYFVPSFSLRGIITISNSFFKREVGIFWEPNFFFAKNIHGNLQTFRNDFLTLTLGHGNIKDHDPRKESQLLAIFSYGYLVKRSGDFLTKHTSRLGAGQLSLFEGHTKIEPAIYFNDFFKGVTPSLRIIQNF